MKETKDVVACVVGYGMADISVSKELSKQYKKVYYYNPTKVDYNTSNQTEVGAGFKEFEKCNHLWDLVAGINGYTKPDIFIFTCIGDGDLQMELERQGFLVWGAREGESMELYRWEFIEYQQKIGMAVAPSKLVAGTEELRKELYKDDKIKFVKIDATNRGDVETFCYSNEIECEINDIKPMEMRMGMKSSLKNFIIQDKIETNAEIGYDGFTIDGKFPETSLFGIEVKDMGYIGGVRPYKDMPEGCKTVNEQLVPALKGYGYRGNISTEIREGEDGKHYLIDLTTRFPYPPTNAMLKIWDNMGECIYKGASGKLVDMNFNSKFVVEVEMFSETAKTDYFTLFMDDDVSNWVLQPYCTFMNDRIWVVPQEIGNHNVGSLIALGDTIEEAINLAKKRAEKIRGHGLKIDFSCLDDAVKEFEKL